MEAAGAGQLAMQETLGLYLDQLDFSVDQVAVRWYPEGKGIPIVLDPKRAFGAPIVEGTGVQTVTLAGLASSGQSVQEIAWWYELEEHRVEAAIRFEAQLARAA